MASNYGKASTFLHYCSRDTDLKVFVAILLIFMTLPMCFAKAKNKTVITPDNIWPGCKIPSEDKITDFNWDQCGVNNGGTYFPISSISDNDIQILMIGKTPADCIRMRWSDDFVTVNIFYGMDLDGKNSEAYFKCKQIQPPKSIFDCEHLRPKGSKEKDLRHTAWITLTDDHSYSFTERCFHEIKQQGWVLFTTKPSIGNKLKKKVLDHAVSLGYDRNDTIDRNYDECEQLCLE